jgi:SAM-dependent methyltransferase
MLLLKKINRNLSHSFPRVVFFSVLLANLLSLSVFASSKWNAEDYENNSSVQKELGGVVLGNTTFFGGNECKVLDVGCGNGNLANEIIKFSQASYYVGLDPSKNMLDLARQNLKNSKIPVEFVETKIQDYTPEKGSFRGVFSFNTLHWVPRDQKDKTFQNMVDSLELGGKLIALFMIGTEGLSFRTATDFMISTEKWKPYFNNFKDPIDYAPVKFIEGLLEKSHLKHERFQVRKTDTLFESDTIFYNTMLNVIPRFQGVLKEKHQEFWFEVMTKYRELTQQPLDQKSIRCIEYVLEIVAVKSLSNISKL